jgi:hypothetical protein
MEVQEDFQDIKNFRHLGKDEDTMPSVDIGFSLDFVWWSIGLSAGLR